MKYAIVDRARLAPHKCLVSADIDGPFVDCGIWTPDVQAGSTPHVYLHVSVAEKIGRSVGMVPEVDLLEVKAQFEAQEAELEKLREIASAIETLQDAKEKVEALA